MPITVDRITDAALEVVATHTYDALTMRSVAGVLDTGPALLYAHVVTKADIDELIIGRLCAQLVLPGPDPATRREQILGVCDEWVVSREELVRPVHRAARRSGPQARRYAAELTSGTGHEQFDFTIGLMVDDLTQRR